jgi:hypothetical protein
MATARAPASAAGSLIVVSAGATMVAMGTSSKPTTLTSPGTDIPRPVSPEMTPNAIWSLKAMTADAPQSTIRGTTSNVASKVGSATTSSTT